MRRWQWLLVAMLGAVALVAGSVSAGEGPAIVTHSLTLDENGPAGQVKVWARDIPEPGLTSWRVELAVDADLVRATACHGTGGFSTCDIGSLSFTGNDSPVGDFGLGSFEFQCNAGGETTIVVTITADDGASTSTPDASITCIPDPMGDANCSGNVDSLDALMLLQFSAGLIAFPTCPQYSDVNENGTIDAIDAAFVLQFVAGLIPSLPFNP